MTRRLQIATGSGCAVLAVLLAYLAVGDGWGRASAPRHFHTGRPDGHAADSVQPATALPQVVFWAWERPEDLRFVRDGQAAVAFLAKTIYLRIPTQGAPSSNTTPRSEPIFRVRPRLQPLRMTAGTPLIAVVRIENPGVLSVGRAERAGSLRAASFSASAPQQERLAAEIAALQFVPGISGIQIDFDAPTSAHPFYAALLREVRGKLPREFPLSITALASWCIGDRWLEKLPAGTIDEAVPMLFRMGPDAAQVARFLRSGREFPVPACRSSLGLSTDERVSGEILGGRLEGLAGDFREKRVYVFSPRSQTADVAESILKEWHP